MQPFIGSAAIRRGELTRRALERDYAPIYRDVYLPRDHDLTARSRAHAAFLATGATLAGSSAAAMFGTKWLDASAPAEVVRADRHTPEGIVVHTWALQPDETCVIGGVCEGVKVTTPGRTAFDIGRSGTPPQTIPSMDALFNATRLKVDDVAAVADAHPGFRGLARLRGALLDVDGGAESPQESRLRLMIVGGGLPRPETQIEFPDLHIRVDMGWRTWKVAVEYDGLQHWTDRRQRSWDIERIALLEAAGWIVIRVSAEMMSRPRAVVDRVRQKLRARGCPI